MLCCFENPAYYPVSTDEKASTDRHHQPTNWRKYPGNSSRREISNDEPPKGTVLLKTGGNALTAVDKNAAMSKDMVAVSVPWNVHPGQHIVVCAPDGSGRCVTTTVPEGMTAGHTFMTKFDPQPDKPPIVAVTGVPVEDPTQIQAAKKTDVSAGGANVAGNIELAEMEKKLPVVVQGKDVRRTMKLQPDDLLLTEEASTPATGYDTTEKTTTGEPNNKINGDHRNLVLVKVPPGAEPGQRIRFALPDTNKTQVETVVPDGNVSNFYVAVPELHHSGDANQASQQNWHNKPAAYMAPMAVLPFIV